MRRCTSCFRFHPGTPTFCSYCGRSFDVRICSRGHRNPRGVQFCSECGSADLSTPAPPASFLHHLSGVVLYLFSGLTIALIVISAVLALLYSIDWTALTPSLVALVLMLGFGPRGPGTDPELIPGLPAPGSGTSTTSVRTSAFP